MADADLTAARARELLHYDPETGIVTRRTRRQGTGPVGSAIGSPHLGYLSALVDYRRYLVHRLAWLLHTGSWPIGQIDHINGLKSDNRIANLRDVDQQTNQQNKRKPPRTNTSGVRGVVWEESRKRYAARIKVDGKAYALGRFKTIEEAEAAYCAARLRLHPGYRID